VASEIGHAKNRSGVMWGIFFGWLGVFALFAMPKRRWYTAVDEDEDEAEPAY
jgi:hypothetical protein